MSNIFSLFRYLKKYGIQKLKLCVSVEYGERLMPIANFVVGAEDLVTKEPRLCKCATQWENETLPGPGKRVAGKRKRKKWKGASMWGGFAPRALLGIEQNLSVYTERRWPKNKRLDGI